MKETRRRVSANRDSALPRSATFGNDSLNRLHTAVATGASPANYNWTYTYDQFGNMQCSGSTSGVDTCAAMTYNTSNNRLSAIGSQTPQYDAAGNMTSDGTGTGSHSYTWDAEGRLTTIASPSGGSVIATYTYNALGQRVQASGSSIGSNPVFQYYDVFGNLGYHGDLTTWGYAPFPPVNGKVYGKYYGRTLFIHSNALGSTGTTTWQDGTWGNSEIYDPWGQRWATSGTLWDERFAGIDNVRDPESGLDQTPNRMLTSQFGRWLSPDPLAGDVSNPQSLNRYAYVLNNPINLTDPYGLDYCSNVAALTDGNGNPTGAYDSAGCLNDDEYRAAGSPDGYTYLDTTSASPDVNADVSALGNIQVDMTGPTTVSFTSPYSFSDTAQRIQTAVGLAPSNIDNNLTALGIDKGHGKDAFHLRDFNMTCTLHVTVNHGPGGQSLTTGQGHLDTLNPNATLVIPTVSQDVTQDAMGLAHLALDYLHLFPGATACQ
jgi:RHS repeat-associated protein